ncbi:MAG: hypothetical protein M1822_002366 [Bathelium mastoideum]|nr:MAG: hypothetical protein M1822_002366 [Bathelium mastoideum]
MAGALEGDIQQRTRVCQELFRTLVDNYSTDEGFQRCQADFNLWSWGIKASATGKSSLDYRVRDYPDTSDKICDYLEGLAELLGRHVCPSAPDDTSDLESGEAAEDVFSETRVAVKWILHGLTRISHTIRSAGTKYRFVAADSTFVEDKLQDLKRLLTIVIMRGQGCLGLDRDVYERSGGFGDSTDSSTTNTICSLALEPGWITKTQMRLIRANLVRRNRILYATRSTSVTSKRTTPGQPRRRQPQPAQEVEKAELNMRPTHQQLVMSNPDTTPPLKTLEVSASSAAPTLSLTQTATNVGSQYDEKFALQSPYTSVATQGTRTGLSHEYPRCPKPTVNRLIQCPYCADILVGDYASNKSRWRGHVAEDLLPYSCIFEDCSRPDEMYVTSTELTDHLKKEHCVKRWICPQCNSLSTRKEVLFFDAEQKWQEHMLTEHSQAFQPEQLPTLSRLATRAMIAPFICPLCRSLPTEAATDDIEHLARCLHGFALLALPPGPNDRQVSKSGSKSSSGSAIFGDDTIGSMSQEDDKRSILNAVGAEENLFAADTLLAKASEETLTSTRILGIPAATKSKSDILLWLNAPSQEPKSSSGMADNRASIRFEKALEDFKKGLRPEDEENFNGTTLEDLQNSIKDLQQKQYSQRRLQNLNRLKPFLEAIDQYGKIVEIFANSSIFVTFIWGPMKSLLQIASTHSEGFTKLLDTYEHIGEQLPLLARYEALFREKPHMVDVLSRMYEDILKFHKIALRYFQQSRWRQLLDARWKTYESQFSGIIANMGRHRQLIESQASITQITEFKETRRTKDAQYENMRNEDFRRKQVVNNWLRATNVETDQYEHCKTRADFPRIGIWLLGNTMFKQWFDPSAPTIPPLLWLCGIPGSGKTVLASLVVEEAHKLPSAPTVLYFYCKYGNSERDNFIALARSLLSQFIQQDEDLLLYLYEQCCDSGEAELKSPSRVEELLQFVFQRCESAYIVLDGLDECGREERKSIAQWFRKLVEDLPISESERLRCLFVSRDDGAARKDFSGLSYIKISLEDSKPDIFDYCRIRAWQFNADFNLSEDRKLEIAEDVANKANGMFSLARLLWINLLGQPTLESLENELPPNTYPKTVYEIYERTMEQLKRTSPENLRSEALMLLGWLVCAKRPMKWHEIQAMRSINFEERSVDFKRRKYRFSPKDLCGSLVELRADDTLELVHLTAKFFLVEEGHVDPAKEDLRMSLLCIDYLNLPAFLEDPSERKVLAGEYAFMDYAVLNWVRHLESGVPQVDSDEPLIGILAESLDIFIDKHWKHPTARFAPSKRNTDRLELFQRFDFYDRFEQTVLSTRKQLTYFGKMRSSEVALDLDSVVNGIREVLERVISAGLSSSTEDSIAKMYGNGLFKCPRFSCQHFTKGFDSADEKKAHVAKHERPFLCTDQACPSSVFGFASAAERDNHVKETHSLVTERDDEFPTEQVVYDSIHRRPGDPGPATIEETADEQPTIRPYYCEECGKDFARKNDYNRHMNTHTRERSHVCHVTTSPIQAENVSSHFSKSRKTLEWQGLIKKIYENSELKDARQNTQWAFEKCSGSREGKWLRATVRLDPCSRSER